MCTVGSLDLPSSGRIIQVSAGSNSPHLGERAFICFHSLTVIHHFCKRQTITSMLYTPCFFYFAGMTWWEYLSNSLAHRTHAVAPMNYSEVFFLTLSWLCHFFIYGIPHWECTTVFCKIEGQHLILNFCIQNWASEQRLLYCTPYQTWYPCRDAHTLHSKHGAWSEQQLHQKLVPYTQSRQIDWFWQVCPNLSGIICSHLHMRRHWHKLAQARGWCPVGEAAVSLQIYSGPWESSHNWGSGGAWQVL